MKTKEKRNKWIMAVLAVLFLITAFITQGQTLTPVGRMNNYSDEHKKQIVTKFSERKLKFIWDGKDTIYLGILADSLGNNFYRIKLYTYFPQSIKKNVEEISLYFDNEKWLNLKASRGDHNMNYTEYDLTKEDYIQMFSAEVNYIRFKDISHCQMQYDKNYFLDFLVSYHK